MQRLLREFQPLRTQGMLTQLGVQIGLQQQQVGRIAPGLFIKLLHQALCVAYALAQYQRPAAGQHHQSNCQRGVLGLEGVGHGLYPIASLRQPMGGGAVDAPGLREAHPRAQKVTQQAVVTKPLALGVQWHQQRIEVAELAE